MSIAENIARVRANIAAAAKEAGRDVSEITLVGASKMNDAEACRAAIAAGIDALGENREQEMTKKLAEHAYDGAPLHFIGHLQRNKVKYIIDKVAMIHSVDSLRLAQPIEQAAAKKELVMPNLLEVNVAEEDTKFGLKVEEVLPLLEQTSSFSHIQVKGLMTIAPFVENPEENREVFRTLKKLSVDISAKNINNVTMSVLSMGMTGDYQVAVQEGSTMVRVGTGIFGERNYATV